ncbi:MAG: efflux RND transporter periplasmic adaptor subunit, partial [Clostridiales bacterium]|nr:efflux RND transporter periplasmic adaptor subunit [Clostridiales bacterium]
IEPESVEEKKAVNVKVQTVETGSIYTTSLISGRIDPIESADVIPLVAGEVTSVNVNLGDYVKKGSVLFVLDKTQFMTNYNQAKIAYDSAKEDYERMSLLYKEGAVSQQQYQGAQTQYNIAKQNLNAASDALNNCTVTSPISGYVTSVNISVGGLASQAMPAVTIADISSLEINTSISENLIGKVKNGDPVNIYIKSLSDQPYSGKFKAIAPAPATGTLTYPVTISIDDKDENIKAGMFAEIEIVTDKRENVICIPSDAVVIKSGEPKVVVLNDNIPTMKTVTTGLDNGTMVEITSGLTVGETIVVSGQHYVVEGEPVNIIVE